MDQGPLPQRHNNGWATKGELDEVVQSKEHFTAILSIKGQYLLPPMPFMTWKFIRQLLRGEKELVKLSEVRTLYVPPRLQELPVTKLYGQIQEIPEMLKYFPDSTRPMDKAYFFAVVSSKFPEFFETVLSKVKERRKQEEDPGEKIEISADMQRLLSENIPYVGPKKKVGHFVKTGREWTSPGRRVIPEFNIRALF